MPAEEPRPGIAAVVRPDGKTRDVANDLWFPNGMAVTPDGTTLVVAESHAQRLTAFTITKDGSLTDRRTWADLGDGAAPDGICLDADGAVWYADVPNRHCRRVAEGGRLLDTVDVDRGCFACMLGGPDGRTLYIVATDWQRLNWQHGGGERTGQVLMYDAPSPHAGRPRPALVPIRHHPRWFNGSCRSPRGRADEGMFLMWSPRRFFTRSGSGFRTPWAST